MGRPRKVLDDLPRWCRPFRDRHGKLRYRLRRTGWPVHYVQAAPGTAEFTQEYRDWLAAAPAAIGHERAKPGSFDDLIARFYRSPAFRQISPRTRTVYRGELERFRATYGSRMATTMTARHVAGLMTKMQATPSAANNLKKRLGQLFDFAILIGLRTDNPARVVRSLRTRPGGHATWQEQQITQFEARWPRGTMQRLAFDLALYTAQRRSDVARMGPQHVTSGTIRITQDKTGKAMALPLHPNLSASIAATPSGHLAFVVTQKGQPFTRAGIGNWFRKACDDAQLPGFAMHGLRKAASRRLAELGLSNQLIKSITGHTSDTEVARYTRDAEQAAMAKTAMHLATRPNPDLANPE